MASTFRVFFSVILARLALLANAQDDYCYSSDSSPYRQFGTSSLYELIFPHPNLKVTQASSCRPTYAYSLNRVGARYYSHYKAEVLAQLRDDIVANANAGRANLCSGDLNLLKSWTSKGQGRTSDDPAPQGQHEVSELGRRLAGALPWSNYNIVSTSNPTSIDSASHFGNAITGGRGGVQTSSNETFRFIENTPPLENILTVPALKMLDQCTSSGPMRSLRSAVSRQRLGFSEDLTEDKISVMYFACAFETAWAPREHSAFCAAFNKEHLKLLEYCYMDVFSYYEWGQGATHVHNPIVDDMLQKLSSASGSDVQKTDFNFISGAAFAHTVANMGLYRDQSTLSADCASKSERHKWSISHICPFAANLLVVLYDCGSAGPKVSLYHNEQPLTYPGCDGEFCSLAQFEAAVRASN